MIVAKDEATNPWDISGQVEVITLNLVFSVAVMINRYGMSVSQMTEVSFVVVTLPSLFVFYQHILSMSNTPGGIIASGTT